MIFQGTVILFFCIGINTYSLKWNKIRKNNNGIFPLLTSIFVFSFWPNTKWDFFKTQCKDFKSPGCLKGKVNSSGQRRASSRGRLHHWLEAPTAAAAWHVLLGESGLAGVYQRILLSRKFKAKVKLNVTIIFQWKNSQESKGGFDAQQQFSLPGNPSVDGKVT